MLYHRSNNSCLQKSGSKCLKLQQLLEAWKPKEKEPEQENYAEDGAMETDHMIKMTQLSSCNHIMSRYCIHMREV